ncbi:MAG: pantetheine-phosphate adenylyltransferase [Elusimicrobiaceae bacterium]|nr:pantetheine-phosphate adenylyltransferase [Elusimicrobiaceae bacterium]
MIKAIYAGSFDPVTNGHLDIISRAAQLFGALTVLVMNNGQKKPLFSVEERVSLLKQATASIAGVRVESADGLLADYARLHEVNILVRGLRGPADTEPELSAAYYNRLFCPTAETVFLAAGPEFKYVSSSAVKEAIRLGGDIRALVPAGVAQALAKKLKN